MSKLKVKAKTTERAYRKAAKAHTPSPGSGSGLVELCIHGPAETKSKPTPLTGLSPVAMIDVIEDGLPIEELNVLQNSLGVSMERLAPKLGISKATLQRRKTTGRLGRDESDRVVRFARLLGKAIDVFEGEEQARKWLTSPQFGLGGATPLDFAETEVGAREVEDLLGRIEHGVYS